MKNHPPVDPAVILFKGAGTWDAIAVAVAGMAPTMAMNLNPQEPAEHVGRVVPLVFALSTFIVLLVAWCFARLARDHPNAGSAYGFVAAILGPRAGLLAGWTLLGTYVCFAAVGLGAAGLFTANLLQRLDLWHDASSFVLTVATAVIVGPLSIIPTRRAGLVLIGSMSIRPSPALIGRFRGSCLPGVARRLSQRSSTPGWSSSLRPVS